MRPPIIITDSYDPDRSGDLEVYLTLEAALLEREVYDVEDPCIRLWDADGRPLMMMRGTFRRAEPSRWLVGRLLQFLFGAGMREILEIVPVPGAEPEPERLYRLLAQHCQALRSHFVRRGQEPLPESATTGQMIEAIARFEGQSAKVGMEGTSSCV